MSILLKNATFVNWKTLEFTQCNLLVKEGLNETLCKLADNEATADTIIDCKGKLVTKSFVVGHHHIYSALATGMPAPAKAPKNFYEILKYIWWNLDKKLDKEMIKASALATAISCAKQGATFVIDHHSSPNYIKGSLNIIAEALDEVGLGHLLCYEISDRDGKEKTEEALNETEQYLQNRQGLVGLHASFTVGNTTLKKAADLVEKYKSGVHLHVAEDLYDQKHCTENYQKRVVERLQDYDLLNYSKSILAHSLHLSDNERAILSNSKAYIALNIESNLNNKVGYFSSKGLGNNIFLGTDGMHSDMLRSMQTAHFFGQNNDKVSFNAAYKRLRKVHDYLQTNNFKGDGENNLVILDYPSATPVTQDNILGHLVYGLRARHVQHVISQGKLIVKDKKLLTVDEQEVLRFAKVQAKNLWEKL